MIVEGVLTEDPYMTYTSAGKAITTFRVLSVDESDQSNSKIVRAVTWEEFAERCMANLREDFKVRLFGNEKERWWTTSGGEKRSQKEFNVYRVQVLK